jgi:hypothetical protein
MGILRGSKSRDRMSALGHKRTFWEICGMSALPPKADMAQRGCDVRFVSKADIQAAIGYYC